ncbi:MAG TPA: hypothetical protein VMS21_13950, partial [Methylomirabilota bacterium]|nr:hypothetical protein [Methylomirabilota bacterium]
MTYLRGCFRWFCRVLVLWTLCLVPIPDVRAADGDLDLTFEPDAAFGLGSRSLAVLDGRVYFRTIGNPIQRLQEDGGLDADWSLPVVGLTIPVGFNRTPWGDFLVRDISTVYRYDDSGERVRLGFIFHNPGAIFPQDDGSV